MIADKRWLTLLIVLFGLILLTTQAYAWADPNYQYRQLINLNTDGIGLSGAVTNDHPIYIDINSSNTNFWAGLKKADCNDIKIYNAADNTALDFYIEQCRTDINRLSAWVEITDSFSNTADTNVYLYYGYASATTNQNMTGTYPAAYINAYNFTRSLTASDTSANALTQSGTIGQETGFAIATNAASSGNSTQGFTITNVNQEDFSIIGMASTANIAPVGVYRMIYSGNFAAPGNRGDLYIQSSTLHWSPPTCTAEFTLSGIANNIKFHFVATSHSTSNPTAYLNGTTTGNCTNNVALGSASTGFLMKHPSASGYGLDGNLDAFRLVNYQLSADEAKVIYQADANNNTFLKFNAQETYVAPVAQARLTFNIYRAGTSSHLSGVTLDSNINAWDFSNQTSPQTTSYVDQNTSYDLNFTKTGYDANYSIGYADSNKTVTIYLTDSTAPTVGSPSLTGFTYYNTIYIKGTGTASATISDTGSGISSCEYSINNGSTWVAGDTNATHCYKTIAIIDQNYTFKFRATDVAGNTGTGTASTTYVGDPSAPTTSLTINQITGTTDQNITIYCDDNASGCKFVQYRINLGTWNYIPQTYTFTERDRNEYVDSNDITYTNYNTLGYNNYVSYICSHYYSGGSEKGTVKYTITYTDTTTADSNVLTDNAGGQNLDLCFSGWDATKPISSIDLNISTAGGWSSPHINDQNIYQTRTIKGTGSLKYFNFLYSGPGTNNIQYFTGDYIDNNSITYSLDFNTYGALHLKMFDENNYTSAFTGDIRFNGTDYNNISSVDLNLQTISSGSYTIEFSETGYGTRYYVLDLNLFTDTNVNMLMLDTTQGTILPYLVFKPDQLTPYAGARVYIYKPNQNNYTIGTYYTDTNGQMSVFTSLLDQNYLFDINSGEETYQPVALTIKIPIDEETNLVLDQNFRVRITGAGLQDYNNENSDVLTYLLPNVVTPYVIKVRDVDGNYFERTYYRSYTGNPLTDVLQPYLISVANGFLTTITAYDAQNYKTLPNVTIEVYKNLPGGRTLVEEIVTDDKGQGLILTILNNQYEFDTYYAGQLIKTFNITATSATVIIYLDIGSITNIDQNASGFGVKFTLFGNGRVKQSAGNLTLTPMFVNLGRLNVSVTSAVTQNGTTLATSSWSGTDFNHTFTHTIAWSDINVGTLTNRFTVTFAGFTYYYIQNYTITDAFDMNYNFIDGLKTGLRSDVGCSATGWCNPLLIVAVFLCIAAGLGASFYMGQFSSQATSIVVLITAIIFTYLTWIPIELTLVLILIGLGFIINERRQ